MSTVDAILGFGIVYGPVLLILGAGLFWAHKTKIIRLRRILWIILVFWAVVLFIVTTAVLTIAATCGGNALYGYANCKLIPATIANWSIIVWILPHALAAASVFATALGGAIAEWRAS